MHLVFVDKTLDEDEDDRASSEASDLNPVFIITLDGDGDGDGQASPEVSDCILADEQQKKLRIAGLRPKTLEAKAQLQLSSSSCFCSHHVSSPSQKKKDQA
ncbi:hypothetical protein E3N88_24038 [Mikania micrantha]|uniref:Uncharacterized protein n=1 Tax=Mikania micrantha TaxID=192012 RepID=A0A5N6NH83_9ASTR|nr:hypothetical protein E3N88_24038 [Mikania micrantha]